MDNLELDYYLKIVNEELLKRGLNTYIPLYPMLRAEDTKLYIAVGIVSENDNVWDKDNNIKPKYWVLIDPKNNTILEFNKTDDIDFVIGELIAKNKENKQKEISKYAVNKTIQYTEYLMEDIKTSQLPIQQKLSNILNNKIEIDGEKVNINEYLIAQMELDIKEKVDELINLLVQSKYSSITFYYDNLFNQILEVYNKNNYIDKDKMKWCIEIMNNYYDGVIGIDNLFNI